MTVKLLTEHHLEFLRFKGSSIGSSESTLVKMPHCWKSHVAAQMYQTSCCSFDAFHIESLSYILCCLLLQTGAESKMKVEQDIRLELLEKQIADLLNKAQVSGLLLFRMP